MCCFLYSLYGSSVYIYIYIVLHCTGRRLRRGRASYCCCQTNKLYSSAWEARKTRRAPRPRRLCRCRKTLEREKKKKKKNSPNRDTNHMLPAVTPRKTRVRRLGLSGDWRTDGRARIYRGGSQSDAHLCVYVWA